MHGAEPILRTTRVALHAGVISTYIGVGSHNHNDCTIQALTNITEKSYLTCKAIAEDFGFSKHIGMSVKTLANMLLTNHFKVCIVGTSVGAKELLAHCYLRGFHYTRHEQNLTVQRWVNRVPKPAKCIGVIRGHAFAVRQFGHEHSIIYDSRPVRPLARLEAFYWL